MKAKNLLYLSAFTLLSLYSCKEEISEPIYHGRVLKVVEGCGSESGQLYMIAVDDAHKVGYEIVCTATLQEQFKRTDTKISFRMRQLGQNDSQTFCNTSIVTPPQVVVYDVSASGEFL